MVCEEMSSRDDNLARRYGHDRNDGAAVNLQFLTMTWPIIFLVAVVDRIHVVDYNKIIRFILSVPLYYITHSEWIVI